jgi:hypothetical protein
MATPAAAPSRATSTPLSAFSFFSSLTGSAGKRPSQRPQPPIIDEEERNDLEGLVQLLTGFRKQGIRLAEVTYVVNRFTLWSLIPMTHHGFIFRTTKGDFFTLDFGRKGIVWDVMDLEPELPDNTFYTKLYKVDLDTSVVQRYCEETPPFNFPFYDCETWAKGMLRALALPDDAHGKGRATASWSIDSMTRPPRKSKEYIAAPAVSAGHTRQTGTCI